MMTIDYLPMHATHRDRRITLRGRVARSRAVTRDRKAGRMRREWRMARVAKRYA